MADGEDPWGGADPNAPDFKDELHARYRVLRATHPVHMTPRGMWRLTRYDDCVRLLKHTATGVRTSSGVLPFVDESTPFARFMLSQDPPSHTRLRSLVQRAFTPRALTALADKIERTTDELLDAVADRDRIDLVASLAQPLPSAMICDMLGVPLDDRAEFIGWTADFTYTLLGPFASPEQRTRANAAAARLERYITDLIEVRRAAPADDLLTDLIRAEEQGDRLSHDELVAQTVGLLIAGFETTTGLIANGTRALLMHPDQLARLRAQPELVDGAVEECLRFDPPIVATGRFLHEDCELGGQRLAKDSRVIAVLIAANRDPAQFDDPDRFDITRSPNRHLAFGGGIHNCLGGHLARLEGRAAFGRLFDRLGQLRLETERTTWGPSVFRIPGELWVTRA
jgi:cytochrome P450